MLYRRAEPGKKKRDQDHPEAAHVAQSEERECGHERAEGEQVALAEALGKESGGNLEGRHRRSVCRADEPDLRQRKTEGLREERQQNVSHVGKTVVKRVRRATRCERAPSFIAYNYGVHVAVYILSAVFIVLAFALVFTYVRERHIGTLLMAMAYGGAAGAAIARLEWWPLLAGLVMAWLVRLAGLDPGAPRDPRP